MKAFFYTLLLAAGCVAAGAVLNPSAAKKYAALMGIQLPFGSDDSASAATEADSEDKLSEFLAQYPFADNKPQAPHAASVPPEPVVVAAPFIASIPAPPPIPEPAPAAAPAPLEQPIAANPMPMPVPIAMPTERTYAAPAADNYFSSNDVTTPLPAQPAPAPAPQQSVYAFPLPVENTHSHTVSNTVQTSPSAPPQGSPFGMPAAMPAAPVPLDPAAAAFEPVSYVPPNQMPVTVPNSSIQTPAVLIEDVPCYGTEMAARVGTQVILMCDILPKLRRAAMMVVKENMSKMPEEDKQRVTPEEIEQVINGFMASQYPHFLQEQILVVLVYNDYMMSRSKADRDFLEARLGEDFDRTEVPELMKEFGIKDAVTLKQYLKDQLGSSLDRERMLWTREKIVQQWIGGSVQRATSECTHDEMKEFYDKNIAMFTSETKARWQELMVTFSKYSSEQEAFKKIAWMGNQVAGGAPFAEIAKANSDGFTAAKGGEWEWTRKGSLASPELEQAVFSQPVGQLSPQIIRNEKGLYLIKVLEREEAKVTPFVEAQVIIREKIRGQRSQRYQEEYFAELKRRFPSAVFKDELNFNISSKPAPSLR